MGATPTLAPTLVIVNQAFVEKYLGKENPLGKQFGQSQADAIRPRSPGYEIVGVVRDAKYNSLRREIHAMMYIRRAPGEHPLNCARRLIRRPFFQRYAKSWRR